MQRCTLITLPRVILWKKTLNETMMSCCLQQNVPISRCYSGVYNCIFIMSTENVPRALEWSLSSLHAFVLGSTGLEQKQRVRTAFTPVLQARLVPTSRSLRTKLDLRTRVLACLPLFYRNQVFSFT